MGGFGYRVLAGTRPSQRAEADATWITDHGEWDGAAAIANGQTALRFNGSGGVVLLDDHLFATRAPDDAVALVEAGAPDVGIYRENRIVAHSTLVGRPISLESAQEVLHDLLRASDRRVTIEEIQKKVAEHFAIRLADMHSPRRARQVARPRQVAMYLAKQLTSRSLPEIGRKFGGRDHTTVMHAVRKIDELRAADAAFSEDVELLRRMLEA